MFRSTLILVATLCGAPALAQTDDFKALVDQGLEHYKNRRYEDAVISFESAYKLRQEPELIYNIARAHEKALKREDAIAAYERFLGLPGTTAELRTKALQALEALRAEKVAMDRAKVPPVSPPPPTVAPPPPATGIVARPEPKSRALEWGLIGGGGVLVATGAVFGVLALDSQSKFDEAPSVELRDQAKQRALIADVCIGTGIVAAGIGAVLFLMGDDEPVAFSPTISPNSIGFAGSF